MLCSNADGTNIIFLSTGTILLQNFRLAALKRFKAVSWHADFYFINEVIIRKK